MKPRSCKAKGRAACIDLVEDLYRWAPDLKPGDIRVVGGGAPGVDILLSPAALKEYPYAIEVKNVEALNIWEAYKQAQSHVCNTPHLFPILFFRRNRTKLMVCLEAEHFFKLTR